MTVARFRLRPSLEFLQWFGLFGAALAWAGEHVIGFGLTEARCGVGGREWGIPLHTSELALLALALVFWALSEGAAVLILVRTRRLDHQDPPPDGRRHFFAVAAVAGNVLFLVAMLLDTIGAVAHTACGQA
jgi:hypothetical protein